MMNSYETMQSEPRRTGWSRPEVVFSAASVTLLIAFLVPFPAILLDVFWVCIFCLAGVVPVICAFARSTADLRGFVPLLSALSLVRLAVLAASARKILHDESPGHLLSTAGTALAGTWPLAAGLVCMLLAAVISIVTFAACQKMATAYTGYVQRILPMKRVGIQSDMQSGLIDQPRAEALARRVVQEYAFFSGMKGTSLLFRGETAICIVALLACLALPAVSGLSGSEYLTQTIPPVVAMSVFLLIPLVTAAASCGALMSKTTLTLRTEASEEPAPRVKKITIVSKETGKEEELELLNPEFISHPQSNERIVEFEPAVEASAPHPETQTTVQAAAAVSGQSGDVPPHRISSPVERPNALAVDVPCKNAEEYYDKLSRMMSGIQAKPSIILLAAETLESLPVTVAVNIAIRSAGAGRKVLLVDADVRRNALAQVFELDHEAMQKNPQPTCFDNLFVCGIAPGTLPVLMQKKETCDQFEMILIYMPNLAAVENPAIEQHSARPAAFFFRAGKTGDPQTHACHKLGFCGMIRIVPAIQSVLRPG